MLQQTQVATVIRYYETWMKVGKIVLLRIIHGNIGFSNGQMFNH